MGSNISRKQCAILSNLTMSAFNSELKKFKGYKNNLNRYLVIQVFPKIDILTEAEFEFIDKQLISSGHKINHKELDKLFRFKFNKSIPSHKKVKR